MRLGGTGSNVIHLRSAAPDRRKARENMQRRKLLWLTSLASLACAAFITTSVHATPTLETGTYVLLPNTPNQVIQIFAHGGDAVQGVTFDVQVGDGGPLSGGTVGGAGPQISNVNIQPAGGIFNPSNAAGQTGGLVSTNPVATESQLWQVLDGTTTGVTFVGTGDTVATHQLLATITIDTTGFFTGQFPLIFVDTHTGNTSFANTVEVPVNAPNGLIIVPEPSSLALLFLGAPLFLLRKRKSQSSLAF